MFKKLFWPFVLLLVTLAVFIVLIQSGITQKVSKGCPASWKTYRNEILGVEFFYNPAWGDPHTSPIENLTKLEGAADKHSETEHNGSANRISIGFDKNRNISLQFFNDNYKGEYYPNAGAYEYGYTDNFPKLKSTANICDYKIEFNTVFVDKLTTIWSNCQTKIKTDLVQKKGDFGNEILYEYTLSSRAFQKNQNGYFDNLLMTFNFGYVRQRSEPVSSLKAVFKGNLLEKSDNSKVSEAIYNQEQKDFEIFVNSVKVFKPITKTALAFKANAGENSDITTIRHYYYYLSSNQLQNAYDMYSESKLDFTSYTDQYKNTIKAEPRDFTKKSDHEFEFYVDYQENNTDPTVYHVKMAVTEDKIKTVLSEEITSPIVKSGTMQAFVKKIKDKNYVVIVENDQETIVDQATTNFDATNVNLGEIKNFANPEFSPNGKYLYYIFGGWEWSSGNVYNIKERKRIHGTESADSHGFTNDEKFFYACNSPGMGGGQGAVWSLSDGKEVFNIAKDSANYMGYSCGYKKGDNFISFILSDYYAQKDQPSLPNKTVKFSF